MLLGSVRNFLTDLSTMGHGVHSKENQNSVDVAVAALLDPARLSERKLGRAVQRALNITHRQIKASRERRQEFDDRCCGYCINDLNIIGEERLGRASACIGYYLLVDESLFADAP